MCIRDRPTRAGSGGGGASGGGIAVSPHVPPVAELAGEAASPPPATFTAVINIKCPDQTGVVRAGYLFRVIDDKDAC